MSNFHDPKMKEVCDTLFKVLLDKVRAVDKNYDIEKINAAYQLANDAHAGQVRKTGEPYISHPIAVAEILLELCMDTDTIVSALLHDVVEDTDITLEELRVKFGEDVAGLVDGVTKIGRIHLNADNPKNDLEQNMNISTEEERKAENIRKILVAMFKDIRVIIIKLADRLHNMRTLSTFNVDKQKRIALESMNFYAPLAHRLGIAQMKEEMEDSSLFYLDGFAYKEIEESLERQKHEGEEFINRIITRISDRLSDMRPPPVVEGRVKGIYSLYKKMYVTNKNLNQIYDVYAVRVITDSTADCYSVLGEIHDMFTPINTSFKDHIANPKVNGYQSLHTTVLGKDKQPFEVQVRTHEMHATARYGVAAHWRYKSGISDASVKQHESKFDFIRQLLDQQQAADDVDNLANAIKTDLSPDEVYAITPRGEVKSFPKGSTVVDFAYAIHTQVGNKMTGAKVHQKMVSYDYVLKTGDVVEIITTSNNAYGPNRSWLNYAKTNEAQAKIRHWLKHERRDENISSGKAYVESVIRRDGIRIDKESFKESLDALAHKHRFASLDDFYAAIGYGGVSTVNAAMWIKDELDKSESAPVQINAEDYIEKSRKKKQATGVIIEGSDDGDLLVKFASCCNPLPGDDIIGFITRGYGVSVHKNECGNISSRRKQAEFRDRLIEAKWSESTREFYTATIEIIALNRKGLLMDISSSIAEHHFLITSSSSRTLKNGNAEVVITVEISNLGQLNTLITKLDKIAGVISVERTGRQ
jgi:GTP pyrophosphokinase